MGRRPSHWAFYAAVMWLVCQTFPWSLATVVLVTAYWVGVEHFLL